MICLPGRVSVWLDRSRPARRLARNGGLEQHCRGNTCIERIVRSEGRKNDSAPRE
jgi:hypothetical protein